MKNNSTKYRKHLEDMNMAAIDLVKAIIAGDTDAAVAECQTELSARAQELVQQGTAYVMNSLSQDMSPAQDE
ncbi:hypothetical protein CHUBBYTHOR_193 [Shigella phage ChubbyThor]|nr:hypothetical protein CHUBBYTHOR_193 [Shigella phage ChubbyThor]